VKGTKDENADKFSDDEKEAIDKAVADMEAFVQDKSVAMSNVSSEAGTAGGSAMTELENMVAEVTAKQKELEAVLSPIMVKYHKAAAQQGGDAASSASTDDGASDSGSSTSSKSFTDED